ncbi:MAG: cytochrome c3 family protein [Sulfuritalea sp.]|nr:cytochrome c3 family protein [Sulfuritalea sp.]
MDKRLSGFLGRYLLGLGGALLLSAMSMGVQAQISGSKHDLTSTGGAGNKVSGTGANGSPEICVFCHTPHASNSNVNAPLWNKAVSSSVLTTYSQTNSSTMDGSVTTGGVSLACLSCHDGSQSMDVLINIPGSGGLSTGARAYGGAGYTWSATADGKIVQSSIANLGVDLTNDHPIQVPYCGGGMTLSGGAGVLTACADADFNAPVTMSANTIAYFDGNSNSKRDKADIQLYSRNSDYFVECGSCHDPHNTSVGTFLRKSNAASAVCLTCHNK